MERFKSITVIFLLAVALLALAAQVKPVSVLLQEGRYAEETKGDLDAAIKIYEQIIKDSSAQRAYVAEATYRLGMCYLKKQNEQKARVVFEQLTAQFADQSTVIDKVQPLLDKLSAPDPAVLMPPDTKVYIEIGNPGRQVETILKMLKGTPFENPLAVIGGGREPKPAPEPGGKSPGEIMAALLNPSMMAEFKKIRGMAVGISAIAQNNPPSVAVLYPGKSDALRGLILAGLGMAGTAGEPIEGMQTIIIGNGNAIGVAHDEEVIIIAQPLERLTWCVKQYKGITNEPTLASQNKVFAKISKEKRRDNALTVWADVAGTYANISQLMSQGSQAQTFRAIDGIADLKNIEDIIASFAIEETGIALDASVNFKEGHNCLPYRLIQTPNLSKVGFVGVPSEAVAIASFALGEAGSSSVETAQKAVTKLTGLSIGREIFANIEQVNLFAVPRGATVNESKTAEQIASCFGLAITSRNPQQTHQLVTSLFDVANLLATLSTDKQSVEKSHAAAGRYVLTLGPDKKIYCYIGQRDKTTILAFSPEVLAASLSAIEGKKSALTAGVLQEPLRKVTADTSKMVLVNVGGAIQVADAYINAIYDNPQNPAHKTLAQLAQACGKTYVQLRTGESTNNFNLHISINQLPPLDSVFPLLMQLSKADLTAQVKATEPKPGDAALIGLKEDMKLIWKPGLNAVSHKVYFGTKIDELSLLAEVSKPDEVKLPALGKDDPYYWRVDEVWSDGTVIIGDVWSFAIGKLIGWWKFDDTEGSTASDSSGNNHTGTLVGNPQWQPSGGKIGGALSFDGVDDYVDCGSDASLNITNAVTIAVWVKLSGPANDQKIAGNQDGNAGGYKFGVYSNKVEFEIRNSKLKDACIGLRRLIAAEERSIRIAESFPIASSFANWNVDQLQPLQIGQEVIYVLYHKTNDYSLLVSPSAQTIASILSDYENTFKDSDVVYRMLDDSSRFITGAKSPQGEPFVIASAGEHFPGWKIELYFKGGDVFERAASERIAVYTWTGVLVIALILVSSAFAGKAIGRQIRLSKLKNDFIATVSHELKTPLASMRVLVDTLLQGNYKDQQQVTEYLQLVSTENERLSRLIDNFLTFSRMERSKQAFEMVRTRPDAIVRAAAEAVKTKFSKSRCKFEVEIGEDLPDVLADYDTMVTVLVNLLDNAYKYSYDDKHIELRVFSENGLVCFSVSDNGIGMSRRSVKKIFKRFYQVDRSLTRRAEGCGLGLSIAKFIVDAHKGSISVESYPGQGSTFTVRLPVIGQTICRRASFDGNRIDH